VHTPNSSCNPDHCRSTRCLPHGIRLPHRRNQFHNSILIHQHQHLSSFYLVRNTHTPLQKHCLQTHSLRSFTHSFHCPVEISGHGGRNPRSSNLPILSVPSKPSHFMYMCRPVLDRHPHVALCHSFPLSYGFTRSFSPLGESVDSFRFHKRAAFAIVCIHVCPLHFSLAVSTPPCVPL